MELGLRRSPRHGVAAKADFSNFLRNLGAGFPAAQFCNKLRALSGAERRVLEPVLIHNTAQG